MLRAEWLRRLRAAGLALAASAGSAAGVEPGLPPIECVDALRRARIERASGPLEVARRSLEAALSLPACELPALAELLALALADPAADLGGLRRRLAGRIADPAAALPPGILDYLAVLEAPAEQDELLLAALEQRRARAEAAAKPLRPMELVELLHAKLTLESRLERLGAARATVAELLALEDSELLRWRALELDVALERWESLASLLESMLRRPGAADDVRPFYVVTLARLGRYQDVLRQLELFPPAGTEATTLPPEAFVGMLVEAGWALRDAGQDAGAEDLFRRALALDPQQESARLVLLHLYGSGEEREAHAAAIAERRQGEADPNALYEEGTGLLAAGDAAAALNLLARAAPGLAGSNFEEAAWYNLGLAAFRLERWREAESALERAAALNPTRAETHFQRGVALFRLERCAEAIVALRRALELKPDRHQAHYFLGRCHAALGERELAAREEELYRRAGPGR